MTGIRLQLGLSLYQIFTGQLLWTKYSARDGEERPSVHPSSSIA